MYVNLICTHINFTQNDVNNATNNNNEVKHIPRVSKVTLHRQVKHTDTLGSGSGWIRIQTIIVRAFTRALKAMSLRIISTVKSTVKIKLRMSDSFVTWSD